MCYFVKSENKLFNVALAERIILDGRYILFYYNGKKHELVFDNSVEAKEAFDKVEVYIRDSKRGVSR